MMSDYAAEGSFDPDEIDVEQDVVYDPESEITDALEGYRIDLRQELTELQRKMNRVNARLGMREYEAEERQIGEKARFVIDSIHHAPTIIGGKTLYGSDTGFFWPHQRDDDTISIVKYDSALRCMAGREPRISITVYEQDEPEAVGFNEDGSDFNLLFSTTETEVYSAALASDGAIKDIDQFIPQDKTGPDWLDAVNEMYRSTLAHEKKQAIQEDPELQQMREQIEHLEDEIARITEEERL